MQMSKSRKSVKPVFPPGTGVQLPGVPDLYTHGHIPSNGLEWSAKSNFRAVSAKDAHTVGKYENGMFHSIRNGYGDEPDEEHHSIAEHESNVRHTIAFPPELADPIAKLRESAADLAKFKPDLPSGFSILGVSPDDDDGSLQIFSDGKMVSALDQGGLSREIVARFGSATGSAELRHRIFAILRDQNVMYSIMPFINYSVYRSSPRHDEGIIFLILARRHASFSHIEPGDNGFYTNGVLYLNGPGGEHLFALDSFLQVSLQQNHPAEDDPEATISVVRTYQVRGKEVFAGSMMTVAKKYNRSESARPVRVNLMISTSLDSAKNDTIVGGVFYE